MSFFENEVPDIEDYVNVSLHEAVANYSFVAGVLYRSDRKEFGFVPHRTGDFWACDCDDYDLKTMRPTGDYSAVWASSMGTAIGLAPGVLEMWQESGRLAKAIALRVADEWDGDSEDKILLQSVLEKCLAAYPDERRRLIGTTIVEESYFETC